jgi:tripartite-type tricarboxylate transporter receptor subunit TctC
MRITRRALPGLAAAVLARPALAAFPDRRVSLTVPFVGGSSADTIARVVGKHLAEELGQPVVIDNRAGAGGLLATQSTIRAAPDGYSLLFSGAQLSNIFWLRKEPEFDPLRDFTPVVRVLNNAAVLLVKTDKPWHSAAELVAAAKAKEGGLSYGSGGVGTAAHIAGAALLNLSGAPGLHVPYNGANQATLALLKGEVDFAFAIINIALPYVRRGEFRALIYAGAKRSSHLPEVPSFPEAVAGAPGMDNWSAIVGPAGMDPAVTERLHAATVAACSRPEAVAALTGDGNEMFLSESPAAFSRFFAAEHAEIGRVVKLAGARPD